MLKEIILINSARFNFARVRLDKDLFFLGTNGNGKTTFIRAIHFLYSADIKSLDIPRDKESFKEYYFKYDNSYIIYVFDEFFIFLHKTSNDINKIFSKQKFNLNRIIKNGELAELSQIKSYLKEAPLVKRVTGVGEYSDIIYGINKKYLDFKIANIKDKEMFLKLFNAVFNVDKAIIDAKSIKKAIFSSINLSDESKFFEPNEYIYKMNEYISKYRFFRSMEQNTKNIEKLKKLKPMILSLEEELLLLSKKINFRQNYEINLLKQKENKKQEIILNLNKLKQDLSLKKKILSKFEDRIKYKINDLILQLKEIKNLKEKFNPKVILEKKELLLDENNLLAQKSELQENIIKLKMGFEDSIKSIENEIKKIKDIISFDLVREKEKYIAFNIQNLDYDNKKEKINFEYEKVIQKLNQQIQKNEEKILLLKQNIESIEKEYYQNKAKIDENINNLQANKYQLNDKLNKELQQQNQKIFNFQTQKDELIHNENKIKREFEDKQVELHQNYQKEIKEIDEEIENLKNLLNTSKGSFKEFLEENVVNWEEEVYPIIDEKLLNLSVDMLEPKIISNQIFGIELNKEYLKSILSKSEIENKLSNLNTKKENITLSYQNSLKLLEDNLNEKLQQNRFKVQEIENKINFVTKNIETIKTDFEIELKNIDTKIENLKNDLKQLKQQKTDKQKDIQNQINLLNQENNTILKEIKTQKSILKSKLQKLDEEKQNKITKIKQEAQKQYQKEVQKYTQKIQDLENQKYNISNDNRLKEFENELKIVEFRLNEIIEAKLFLKDYESQKAKIDNEFNVSKLLEEYQNFKKQFIDRLKNKIKLLKDKEENTKFEIETINKEIYKISQGLNKEIEVFSDEEIECDEFLLDLKNHFEKTRNNHQNNLLNLKNIL